MNKPLAIVSWARGNDEYGNGTHKFPYKTLGHWLDIAQPGETVFIEDVQPVVVMKTQQNDLQTIAYPIESAPWSDKNPIADVVEQHRGVLRPSSKLGIEASSAIMSARLPSLQYKFKVQP